MGGGCAKGSEEVRKRERFQNYLQERSVALHAMMALHGSDKVDVVVETGLLRLLLRLGWLDGKSRTATAARTTISTLFDPLISHTPAEDSPLVELASAGSPTPSRQQRLNAAQNSD